MQHDTLYKRTSTGAIQIWYMETDGDKYRSTSGQIDGKKVTSEWTVALPKNEGRANETTAAEQALSEVASQYKKKIKSGYFRSVEDIDVPQFFKPMLAAKWVDRKDKIKEKQVHIQPKLDGVRCIAKRDGLFSRNGEPILGAPHIFKSLEPLLEQFPDLILDGELYNHDYKDDFNSIVSCVKKQKPTDEELKISRNIVQYWVYDCPSCEGDFTKRIEYAATIGGPEHYNFVDSCYIDIEDVDEYALAYIESGFEGAMIRLSGEYENKRSKTLLKWKEFQDEEFEIVDIQEGVGNRAGMAARTVHRLPDGRTFSAGMIGNLEYCKQLLIDKDLHIGKIGTVVFQNYTPDGVPRFPKFKTIRNYE